MWRYQRFLFLLRKKLESWRRKRKLKKAQLILFLTLKLFHKIHLLTLNLKHSQRVISSLVVELTSCPSLKRQGKKPSCLSLRMRHGRNLLMRQHHRITYPILNHKAKARQLLADHLRLFPKSSMIWQFLKLSQSQASRSISVSTASNRRVKARVLLWLASTKTSAARQKKDNRPSAS